MNPITHTLLPVMLTAHKLWLECDPRGCRLVLSRADLRGAVLRGAVLSDAVLSGAVLSDAVLSDADLSRAVLNDADLSRAVLMGAELRGAVLRGAVLSDADLSYADLTNTGIVCLAVGDPRGYRPVLFEGTVYSGCRAFTIRDALAHWGSPEYHKPELGAAYCRAIKEATSHE